MSLLGARLRQRRRQLGLLQKDVAGQDSASFLSKVENGFAHPSLANLRDWAAALETTAADLLGDHLVLEAAKQSILLTDKCLSYLDHLPPSPIRDFLRQLTMSATSLSTPVPDPPPDPSLEYLTAQVHLYRGEPQIAEEIAIRTLERACSLPWRFYHLALLCQIYERLHEVDKRQRALNELKACAAELDHDQLVHSLSEAGQLSAWELDLVRTSALLKNIKRLLD